MINKNIICIYVVTALLLYDLLFDNIITWLFSPRRHCIVHIVMAVMRTHVVMAVISLTFPKLSKLPCSLYIPSRSFEKQMSITHSPGTLHVFNSQIMETMDGLKVLVSFLLSFFNTVQNKAFSKH